MIWIDRVKHRSEERIAATEPASGQREHGQARQRQHHPDIDWGGQSPRKDRAESGAQGPGSRRIKQKARLTVAEMRERRPAGKNDPMLPLREDLQPGVEVKFNIMP